MKSDILQRNIRHALSGKGAHVEVRAVFDGLHWKLARARPQGIAHSAFQLLGHMSYWQDWAVRWLDGGDPPLPTHASESWPADEGPSTPTDWKRAVARFRRGLAELERWAQDDRPFTKFGTKTRLEMLHTIGSHNSYHAGQVALLRQMLDSWPPPSGGLTW